MQEIQIYMAPKGSGPNPWKVAMALAELDLEWKIVWISYSDIKTEPYISLNPNGRLPAMIDPNTNITLFESGAIIEYLIDTYDKDHKISFSSENPQAKWLVHSWLMFQMSGQGPMFGQRMWFVHFHGEKLRTALDRYAIEVKRIVGVLDSHLKKRAQEQGIEDIGHADALWLVGDKYTFADLSFVLWNTFVFGPLFPGEETTFDKDFPYFYRWQKNIEERPAIRKILEMRERLMEELADQDTGAAVIARQNKEQGL